MTIRNSDLSSGNISSVVAMAYILTCSHIDCQTRAIFIAKETRASNSKPELVGFTP